MMGKTDFQISLIFPHLWDELEEPFCLAFAELTHLGHASRGSGTGIQDQSKKSGGIGLWDAMKWKLPCPHDATKVSMICSASS